MIHPLFQPVAVPAPCYDYLNRRLAQVVIEAVAEYDEETLALLWAIVSDWAREAINEN